MWKNTLLINYRQICSYLYNVHRVRAKWNSPILFIICCSNNKIDSNIVWNNYKTNNIQFNSITSYRNIYFYISQTNLTAHIDKNRITYDRDDDSYRYKSKDVLKLGRTKNRVWKFESYFHKYDRQSYLCESYAISVSQFPQLCTTIEDPSTPFFFRNRFVSVSRFCDLRSDRYIF